MPPANDDRTDRLTFAVEFHQAMGATPSLSVDVTNAANGS
jgi:hypothetical protein